MQRNVTSNPKRRVRRAGRTKNKSGQGIQTHPPQINDYEISHKKRLRFTCTTAQTNFAVTYADLLDLILLATTAVVGYDVFDLVQVKRVQVWAQGALGTPTTCQVEYATVTGDRSVHTDTSLGVSPAFVNARPSPKSLASFFQQSAAGTCFLLTCPVGSVIDVHLMYRTSSTIAPQLIQNLLVGATVGQIYFRGLDGLASAGTVFPPPNGVGTQ